MVMGSRQQGYDTLKGIAGELLLSPFEDYNNLRTLLSFKCTDCTNEFNTTGFLFSKSDDGKRCLSCERKKKVNDPDARDVFIKECNDIHSNYYSYENLQAAFTKTEYITVTCPKHGDFKTTGDQHQHGVGCKHCKVEKVTAATRSNTTEFVLKASTIHKCKYSYEFVVYKNAITNVDIFCPKHGIFKQTPDVHLRGCGCPKCKTSAPISKISDMLDRLDISYTIEKTFTGCVGNTGKKLRFDIFIPQYNLCVEYDGIHHYKPTIYGSYTIEEAEENFISQQYNDNQKDIFCNNNNIKLIRIPYTDLHPDATLQKYIQQESETERYMYSYDDLNYDAHKIANYINSFNYNEAAVYGISRGGVPFAVHVSNLVNGEFGIINYQRYDGNSKTAKIQIKHQTKDIPIFLIDDLISSGITMKKAISSLQHKFKKAVIHPIVIFGNENDDNIFFLREHPGQWIIFPYETS
jgi:hypoxanthine phosphoribosyltransferase